MATIDESRALKKRANSRPGFSELARRLAEENREALDYLEAYDRGEKTPLRPRPTQPK